MVRARVPIGAMRYAPLTGAHTIRLKQKSSYGRDRGNDCDP